MAVTAIINIVLAAVIVICAWQGFKKGIIMGLVGVLVIILSLYGAQLLSDTFSYEVIPVLKPFVGGVLDSRVEDTAYEVLGYEPNENGEYIVSFSLTDLMERQPETREAIFLRVYQDLGLYDNLAEELARRAVDYANQNEADVVTACTMVFCQAATWYGGTLLAFILIYAILTVIVNLPNLSFRIPYIGIVNDLGGLAIGVYTGFLFCALIVWLFQFAGLLITEDTLYSAGIAGYFLDKNMLAPYISF